MKNEESKPVILDASDSEDDSQDLLEHFASRNARYAENVYIYINAASIAY